MPKGRDSGMPPVDQWESYFDAAALLDSFGIHRQDGDAVEFGCGYGTFTCAAARRVSGRMFSLDIDPAMVRATSARAEAAGLTNVVVEERDFLTRGSGRPPRSTSLALIFNILHIEEPVALLEEAYRGLRAGGRAALIHWKHDPSTPRGPPLDIRPRPAQCRSWGEQARLRWLGDVPLAGAPWHWGMLLERPV